MDDVKSASLTAVSSAGYDLLIRTAGSDTFALQRFGELCLEAALVAVAVYHSPTLLPDDALCSPPRTSRHLHCAHQCFQHTGDVKFHVHRLMLLFSDQERGRSASECQCVKVD